MGQRPVKHGMRKTSEYRAWIAMKNRCANNWHPNYGGRGIRVCDRWLHSFENFYADVGPKPSSIHTLERENVNKDYEPGNVKWATPKEQTRNQRRNHLITINGVTHCLAEWAELHGINQKTVLTRIRRGASPVEALTRPITKNTS